MFPASSRLTRLRPGQAFAVTGVVGLFFLAIVYCAQVGFAEDGKTAKKVENNVGGERGDDNSSPIFGVKIPEGYRQWELIAPSQSEKELKGIVGNSISLKAYRDSKLPFPDGSILVKLSWEREPLDGFDGTFVPGAATMVQVMVKDSKKYASTGGWGFGRFIDGKPVDAAQHNTCFACHSKNAKVREQDFVFTQLAPGRRMNVEKAPTNQTRRSTTMEQDSPDNSAVVTLRSAHGVAETTERLKAVLAHKGIRLFAHIDHAAEARKVGLPLRPTQVLIFGNPRAGTPLMQSRQTMGLDLPLRVLVWEDEAGKVWLTYHALDFLAGLHHVSDRDGAVEAMDAGLTALARAATDA
jgi:uncharacterized protein (DUF302 family)